MGARAAQDGDDGAALAKPAAVARAASCARLAALLAALAGGVALSGGAACSAEARLEVEPRALGPAVRAPHAIDFATASAGLADAAGHATGFSVVLPVARGATNLSGRVRVDPVARELVLSPRGAGKEAGAGSETSALGLPVVFTSARSRVETTLVAPARGAGAGESAGLWFGASEGDSIELSVTSSAEGLVLRAVMAEDDDAAAPITRGVPLPVDSVRLALELQPAERLVRAYASVGATGAEQLLATFEAVPEVWFDRDRVGLMDGDASPRGLVGVFARAGARPAALPPLAHRFRGFEVTSAGFTSDPQPAPGQWQRGAASTLPAGLVNAAAATLEGKIYVIGGSHANPAERALFIFDPDTETWQPGPRLPESLPAVTTPSVVAHRGALVVIGGLLTGASSASRKVVTFDPATGAWGSLAPLPVPLGAAVAESIAGDLYVAGGLDGAVSHAELWVMRAGASRWAPAAPMSSGRHGAASAVIDGRLFVFGGMSEGGAALALAEVYDPKRNEWTALAPLPAPVSFASATAAPGRAVVLAGEAGSPAGSPAWSYDAAADAWSVLPPGPRPRSGAAAAWRGGAVYVLGGAGLDGAVDVLRFQ